ncbi:MAG: polymerase subunit gamma/tau, partial [Verrucomicrobiota bacterium]
RLLELIDQFAAAEGRMKWAPNKRLHFEVAVIKAIQTLSQVTLNEVIENLAALRNGKAPAVAATAAGAGIADPGPRPAKMKPVEKVAEVPKPAEASKPAEISKPAGVTDPDSSKVQEQPAMDFNEAWRKAVEKVRATRRLIAGWVEAGTALGVEGRFLVVGFPPEQKSAMESLSIPKTRDYIDAILKEVSGQDWKVKFVVKEGLPVPAPIETAVPKKPETQETFQDDPLIREALEIFKGEIKTVTD